MTLAPQCRHQRASAGMRRLQLGHRLAPVRGPSEPLSDVGRSEFARFFFGERRSRMEWIEYPAAATALRIPAPRTTRPAL